MGGDSDRLAEPASSKPFKQSAVVKLVEHSAYLARVFPVHTIDEGITLLTGREAGEHGPNGTFPEGSVNGLVQGRLREMAEQALAYKGDGQVSPRAGRHDELHDA